jgi:hypothetical protein
LPNFSSSATDVAKVAGPSGSRIATWLVLIVFGLFGCFVSAASAQIRWPSGPYLNASAFARDAFASTPGPAPQLRPAPDPRGLDIANYSASHWAGNLRAAPLEVGLAAGALLAVGFGDWKWGDSKFHMAREGWFGKNTHSGGMDKLGHAWTTFVVSEVLAERMQANSNGLSGAHLTAASIAFALMVGVEFADGVTKQYGFSREDVMANAAGAGLALLRGAFPKLKEIFDYRMMITPSSYERAGVTMKGTKVLPPYRRQRFILAFKASGFETLRNTPLRYLELQLGYDARGFHAEEKKLGYKKERNFYVGLGLNLNELLFAPGPVPNLSGYRDSELVWATETVLRYVQPPFTGIAARSRH